MIIDESQCQNPKDTDYAFKDTASKFDNDIFTDSEDNELRKRTHVCHVCFRGFSKLSHLKRHKFSHTKEKHFHCNHCDKSYSRNDHLQRHLTTHGLISKPYVCPVEDCKMTFYDSAKFRKHFPTHNKLQGDYIIFGRKVQVASVGGKAMLACPMSGCSMLTKTLHGMRKHIFSHNSKRDLSITNQVMKDSFDESSNMEVLKRVYVCGYKGCNYSYTRKSNAIAHINVCHKNLTYKCDKCNLIYKWKRSLDKHKCKGVKRTMAETN